MKRLTHWNYKNTTLELDSCKPYLKLGQLEDIEEEIGIDLITLFRALKNGFNAEHRYIQQCYICFIDGEWAIVNLKNDEWWLLKDYGKTWALDKNELTKELEDDKGRD